MISTEHTGPQRRFGNRVVIAQPAELCVGNRVLYGTIHNVGLTGAFFCTTEPPVRGSRGVLTCEGNQGVEVRVVWQRQGHEPGVGLAFDSLEFRS